MAPAFTEQKMRMAGRLLAARKRSHLSQERAASLVGTSRRHWIRWERGETMPNPVYLERIVEVLAAPELIEASDDDEEAASLPLNRDEFALLGVLMARLGVTISDHQTPQDVEL